MFQIDPAAFFLAIVALYFAWRVERRNTTVMLRLLECEQNGTLSLEENQGRSFSTFRVRIKNIGISLHDPTVHLTFSDAAGVGNFSIEFVRETALPSTADEFQKGMIADFTLKTYQLHEMSVRRIAGLLNLKKQKARLTIRSQGYIAAEIPLDGTIESIRQRWNVWAFKINQRFWRNVKGENGQEYLDTRGILPSFEPVTAVPLTYFADRCRKLPTEPEFSIDQLRAARRASNSTKVTD